jgi:hypothetical protein
MSRPVHRTEEVVGSAERSTELGRMLREVVGAYAAPELAEVILHRAVVRMPRSRPPSTPARLREFVRQELREEVAAVLGDDVAHAVLAELVRALVGLESATRHTRSTAPPAPRPDTSPILAVLTEDPRITASLVRDLTVAVEVRMVESAAELEAIPTIGRPSLMLVDVRWGILASLEAIGPRLRGRRALIWGDDVRARARVATWIGTGTTTLAFPSDLEIDELAPVIEAELAE